MIGIKPKTSARRWFIVVTLGVIFCVASMPGCKLPSRESTRVDNAASNEVVAEANATESQRDNAVASQQKAAAWDTDDSSVGANALPAKLASSSTATEVQTKAVNTLKLRILHVAPNTGPVRIAVFGANDGFPKHETASVKQTVNSDTGTAEIAITGVPAGVIAVAVYQDINDDGKLNRGTFGIPTEPYGFSNDAKGSMGPPTFKDAVVDSNRSEPHEITLSQVRF